MEIFCSSYILHSLHGYNFVVELVCLQAHTTELMHCYTLYTQQRLCVVLFRANMTFNYMLHERTRPYDATECSSYLANKVALHRE